MSYPRGVTAVGVTLVLVAVVAAVVWHSRPSGSPTPRGQSRDSPAGADIETCDSCHSEVVAEFRSSPHFNTLHRATDPEFRARLLDGFLAAEGDRPELKYLVHDTDLVLTSNGDEFPYPTSFIFGSGRHGHTAVSVRLNEQGATELLEHSISWYPRDGLGLTIGRSQDVFEGWKRFGHPLDSNLTSDCFGCHTSWLPRQEAALDLDHAILGIRCNRCHLRLEEHIASGGDSLPLVNLWDDLSPRDAIRRCGECHRTPDVIPPDELAPENATLVRFAPIGLELCQCFQNQGSTRLDCTTCHDPHRRPENVNAISLQACLKCHGQTDQTLCTAQPLTSNCLECHMPKVAITKHVSFTDHWIR